MKKYINVPNADLAKAFLDLGVMKEDKDGRLFAVGSIKFSALPVGSAIQDADIAPWVQSGVNVKQSASAILNYVVANLDSVVTMQYAYDNSVLAGTPFVVLSTGSTPQYVSTTTPVALNPPMTTVQRDAISIPLNSATVYDVTTSRISCQTGPAVLPNWEDVAWLSDVQAIDTQQKIYDNSPTGNVNLSTGKHQGYTATDAAFYLPSMTSAQFDAMPSPPNGLIAWANDLDRFRLNKSTPGAPVYDTLAYLSDIASITTDGAIGEAYFTDNATETVISVADTPVIINGTFLSGSNNTNFSQANGRLTNTGSEAFVVRVGITMAAYFASGATGLINVFVYVNGSEKANLKQQYSIDGVSSTPKPLPLMGYFLLNPGDYIEPFVSNVSGTDNIIVKSINFNANTIGGAGDAGALTWNQTIVNGDGTATATAGKFISVESNDTLIPAEFGFNYTSVPIADDIIGKLTGKASGIVYSQIITTADSSTPTTDSIISFLGYSASSQRTYMEYSGSNDTLAVSSALTILGDQNAGVNGTLGTVTDPELIFPAGVYTNIWNTLDGTNVIVPNSLAIGQSVEINITGIISADFPFPNADAGSHLRLTVGSLPAFITNSIYSTNFSDGAKLPWNLAINITRLSSGDIAISAAGYYTNSLSVAFPIVFVISADVYAYNSGLSYPLTLEFLNGNSVNNVFSFIARNLKIIQYT